MIANKRMKALLKDIDNVDVTMSAPIKDLQALLNPIFIKVNDCIIFVSEPPEEGLTAYTEKLKRCLPDAVKMYTDEIGYEAANSSTQINYAVDNELTEREALAIGLLALDLWYHRLKSFEPDSRFCFIITSTDEVVTIRFHKVRGDGHWLANDLEGYDEPVGYYIK